MVIPLGERWGAQELSLLVKREDGGAERRSVLPVRFVPMVHPG
jgi:protein-L-isoaspartate O-methyltransferase